MSPRSRNDAWRWLGRAVGSRLATVLLVLALAPDVIGHQVSVMRGTAVLRSDRISISVTISAEDFLHWAPPAAGERWDSPEWLERARRERGEQLAQSLILRDQDGERLIGRLVHSSLSETISQPPEELDLRRINAVYTVEYTWAAAPRFIVFQNAAPEPSVSLASQILLEVRADVGSWERLLRLTNRGNLEVIEICWNGQRPAACPTSQSPPGCDAGAIDEVSARIEAAEDEIIVEVSVPLPLLETWVIVPRADGDRLSPREQGEACALLRPLFESGVSVQAGEQAIGSTSTALRFVGIGAEPTESKSHFRPLGALTARLHATLRFPRTDPGPCRVTWALFNSAVLTTDAVVTTRHQTFEHRFSTYDPTLVLTRLD